MNLDEKILLMEQKFIKCREVVEALDTVQSVGNNIVLWGEGGYAKSQMTTFYFQMQGIEPFVQTMGTGTTEDKLMGGLNLPLFQSTGKQEYLVEESFMAHEYVIFEELFDAPMRVIQNLKDILTAGELRNGSQRYKIKTKMIVANTNRAKHEVVEDASGRALADRFPYIYNVGWDSHEKEDFEELFLKVKKDKFSDLAHLIASVWDEGSGRITPRTAIIMSDSWKTRGVEGLKFIDGVPAHLLDVLRSKQATIEVEEVNREHFTNFIDSLVAYTDTIMTPIATATTTDMARNAMYAGYVSEELKNILTPDDYTGEELKRMIEVYNKDAKTWHTMIYEDAEPRTKELRPLIAIFDEYKKNTNQSV